MTIRLYNWQVERLKSQPAHSGAQILRHAVLRYNRGDFGDVVAQKRGKEKKPENVPQLASYSLRARFNLPDALLREILTLHWRTPDAVLMAECDRNIKRLDAQIEELMRAYANTEYIIED